MKTPELLTVLSDLNIQLREEGDQLRYRAPKGALTSELLDLMLQNKEGLIAHPSTKNLRGNVLSSSYTQKPAMVHQPSDAQKRIIQCRFLSAHPFTCKHSSIEMGVPCFDGSTSNIAHYFF